MDKATFVALGGGQRIGASCYFVGIGGKRFLFDCGMGFDRDSPDFTPLYEAGLLTSLSELDAIFISHAHFDHIGYLPYIAEACPSTPIYVTHTTKALGQYMMRDREIQFSRERMRQIYFAHCERAFLRMGDCGYLERLECGGYTATFYEAGHIPGAAMIHIESGGRGLLYTGDFSREPTPLTSGYILPDGVSADTVVLCGTHAKHPDYVPRNQLERVLSYMRFAAQNGESVLVHAKQITKGVEIVKFLLERMDAGLFPRVDVYVDDKLWRLHDRLSEGGGYVFDARCRRIGPGCGMGVYVDASNLDYRIARRYDLDYTLHADYGDLVGLLSTVRPRTVFVVHTSDDRDGLNEYRLITDMMGTGTRVTFAQEGQIYLF